MSEENKAIIRRAMDAMNTGDLGMIEAAFDKTYSPDLKYDGMGEQFTNLEDLKEMVAGYITAFPDMRVTIEDQIAEGDCVVTRFTAQGTNDGDFGEVPATGRKVSISLISIVRIEDGIVVEEWEQGDQMGMMAQLGLIPN